MKIKKIKYQPESQLSMSSPLDNKVSSKDPINLYKDFEGKELPELLANTPGKL